MALNELYDDIVKAIPGFDLSRCLWMLRLDVWVGVEGRCCRLVLNYEDRLDIALVAKGVSELPRIKPAATPGVLPYSPYDLGELLVTTEPTSKRLVLFDELKGWRMVAESLSFEGVTDHAEAVD